MSSNKSWTNKTFMQMKEDIIVSNAKKRSMTEQKKRFSKKWGTSEKGTTKIFKILDPQNKFSKILRGK